MTSTPSARASVTSHLQAGGRGAATGVAARRAGREPAAGWGGEGAAAPAAVGGGDWAPPGVASAPVLLTQQPGMSQRAGGAEAAVSRRARRPRAAGGFGGWGWGWVGIRA
jgi:hypothetical protein